MAVHTFTQGFSDPVQQSQTAFRAALQALSRPGRVFDVGAPLGPASLQPAVAHLLLALTDQDTPVWWQHPDASCTQWLQFHTSAGATDHSDEAAFAVLTDAAHMPSLDQYDGASATSPEHSTTLLIEVPSLTDGPSLKWRGPGIRDHAVVSVGGLPEAFWSQWAINHGAFPQGVDVLFCCGTQVLGLPRTTAVHREEN